MVIEQLLVTLEKIMPDVEDLSLAEVCKMGTPYTIELYIGNSGNFEPDSRLDEDYINFKKFLKYFDHCKGIEDIFFAVQQ